MVDEIEDFWPTQLSVADLPEPVALLEAQAKVLWERTQGQIEGFIDSYVESGSAYYSFHLKAKALGDYLYKLLYIAIPTHRDPRQPFPIAAQTAFGGPVVDIANAEEFRDWLRSELKSDHVQVTINNLLLYVRESRKASLVS